MSHLFFNPCVTLATRWVSLLHFPFQGRVLLLLLFSVRVEILRSLSQRVTSSQLLTYCVSNGPRPKLSVGPANGFPGRRTALFYAEALRRYGYLLEEANLEKAYDWAQMFFTGELFLVS